MPSDAGHAALFWPFLSALPSPRPYGYSCQNPCVLGYLPTFKKNLLFLPRSLPAHAVFFFQARVLGVPHIPLGPRPHQPLCQPIAQGHHQGAHGSHLHGQNLVPRPCWFGQNLPGLPAALQVPLVTHTMSLPCLKSCPGSLWTQNTASSPPPLPCVAMGLAWPGPVCSGLCTRHSHTGHIKFLEGTTCADHRAFAPAVPLPRMLPLTLTLQGSPSKLSPILNQPHTTLSTEVKESRIPRAHRPIEGPPGRPLPPGVLLT